MCKLETLACSYSGAVNQTNCAFYDRSMKLSVVFLYTLKFVFRRGATSELTSGTGQRPNQIWPPSPMMKIQLGGNAHVIPLFWLIGVWGIHFWYCFCKIGPDSGKKYPKRQPSLKLAAILKLRWLTWFLSRVTQEENTVKFWCFLPEVKYCSPYLPHYSTEPWRTPLNHMEFK